VKIGLFSFLGEEFLRLPEWRCSCVAVFSVCAAQSNSTCSTRFGTNSWKLLFGVRSPLLSRSYSLPVKRHQCFSSSSRKHVTWNVYIKLVGIIIIIIYDLPLQELSRVKQILTTYCIKLTLFWYFYVILHIHYPS